MDTNEIMANEEVIEATKEIVNANLEKGFMISLIIGLGVLNSVYAYRYIVRPIIAEIKAKKEQQTIAKELENFDEAKTE